MGKAVQSQLEPVRGRQQFLRAIAGAAWGLLVASLVGAAALLAKVLAAPALPLWLPLAIAAGGAALGFVAGLLYRRRLSEAAAAIDSHYALKDRAATALEFASKPELTSAHELALRDAMSHLQTVVPREVVPLRMPRVLPYALATLAATLVLAVVSLLNAPAVAGPPEANDVVLAQAERAAEELQELEEFAKKENDPELNKLLLEMKAAIEELKNPATDLRGAMAKLSEMQAALQAEQAKHNVAAVDANMKALGAALSLAQPLAEAGQALSSGDYEKAAQQLENLEAPELDRQTEKATQEKLAAAAKQAESDGQNALSKAAGEMAQGLGEKSPKFSEGSKKLAGEASKQAKRKKLTDLLMKQSNCLGECKCECEGECKSTAKNGKKKGGKKAGLAASGNEPGEKTPQLGTNKHEKLTGQQSDDGDVETETTHTPEASQQAQREYRENFAKYKKLTESVLENEPIPLGHRQTIRKYFESIRPNDAETDKVQERLAPQ
jgi:hypothetical protein